MSDINVNVSEETIEIAVPAAAAIEVDLTGGSGPQGEKGDPGTTSWNGITDKPTEFNPSAHNHDDRYYTESETDDLLDDKSDVGHTHDDRYYTETETDTLLGGKSDTSHTHDDRYYTETETDTLLSGKSDTGHTHDDRYYTETETDTLLSGKANSSHTHAISDVTNLQTSLDGKAASSHTHAISDVTNLQTSLDGKASSSHTHSISDVTGLQTALDGKQASGSYANAVHTHSISDVTNLQTSLDGKEPTLTKGNLTESTSSVLTITGGTNAVIGSGTSVQVKQASSSQSGFLSSTDWSTFNGKQNALTNPVTGTGTTNELTYFTGSTSVASLSTATYPSLTELSYVKGVTSAIQTQLNGKQATLTNPITGSATSGQVGYFSGSTALSGSSNLFWDAANNRLGIGRTPSARRLEIQQGIGSIASAIGIYEGNGNLRAILGIDTQSTDDTILASTVAIRFYSGATLGNVATLPTNERMRLFSSTGNLLLQNGGTFTDGGQRLQVTGTTLLTGSTTITGSTTASSAIARGANITSTLVAAANNDVLVGLDVNPSFTSGAFTGLSRYALRVSGQSYLTNSGANTTFDSGIASDARLEFRRAATRIGLLNWDTGLLGIQMDSANYFYVSAGGSERFRIDSSALTYADAINFAFGTTTGTKIGTSTSQKLSFWNATPVTQRTTAGTAATLVSNAGTTITDTDTFDGYTLKQVVKALRDIGLLA